MITESSVPFLRERVFCFMISAAREGLATIVKNENTLTPQMDKLVLIAVDKTLAGLQILLKCDRSSVIDQHVVRSAPPSTLKRPKKSTVGLRYLDQPPLRKKKRT